jgi:hypothetical protein
MNKPPLKNFHRVAVKPFELPASSLPGKIPKREPEQHPYAGRGYGRMRPVRSITTQKEDYGDVI